MIPLTDEIRFVLSKEENYATLAYTLGLWDFAEMSFLLHLLREGDLFFDVGANVGAYTVLASAGAGAHTIAFEPIPRTFEKLRRNIAFNSIGHLVEARQVGVGDHPGSVFMTTDRGGLNHVARASDTHTQALPFLTLDSVASTRCPLVVKLDIEGYEHTALRGASSMLANPQLSALIVECNQSGVRFGVDQDDVDRLIRSHGFRRCSYDPMSRKLAAMEIDTANDSINVIYCRNIAQLNVRLKAAASFRLGGVAY